MTHQARVALTAAVAAGFLAMLVATCKPRPDGDVAPSPSSTSAAAADDMLLPEVELPDASLWKRVELPRAGLSVAVPEGAVIAPEASGQDSFSGRFFRVQMPSGYVVTFAQNTGTSVDMAETKRWYRASGTGFEGVVYEAPDGLIAARKEGPPVGEYWEVTACSRPVGDKPLCASSEGALVEGSRITKLTHPESLATVAIARTIAAPP